MALPCLSLVWNLSGVLYFFVQVEGTILYAGAQEIAGNGWKVWTV